MKHPPLNTAMNSSTDLMIKIILCISSFKFLYSPNLSHLLIVSTCYSCGFSYTWLWKSHQGSEDVLFLQYQSLGFEHRNHLPSIYSIREYGSASSLNALRKKGSRFSPQSEFSGTFWKSFVEKGLLRIQMLGLEAG